MVGFWYSLPVEGNEGKTVTFIKMRLKKFVELVSWGVFDVNDCIWWYFI